MTDEVKVPEAPEPSNTKVAVGAVKTWLTTDGPIQFTKTMVFYLALAVAIGCGLGYFSMSAWTKRQELVLKREQMEALKRDAKETAKGIASGVEKSRAIESKVQQGNLAADASYKAALERLNAQLERRNDELEKRISELEVDDQMRAALADLCAAPRLDAGTVRMLNDARRSAVEPARRAASAGKAATPAS